jgi:hypothetical protein
MLYKADKEYFETEDLYNPYEGIDSDFGSTEGHVEFREIEEED